LKVSRIRKRDGSIQGFNPDKITMAIYKAMGSQGLDDRRTASKLSGQVVKSVETSFGGREIPTVEQVQDLVESTLMRAGYAEVAKAYILYRQKRAEIRAAKKLVGVSDDLKLSVNATRILMRRYLLKDELGSVIETPGQMFRRVAKAVAAVDRKYEGRADWKATEDAFYRAMANLQFLPNSPTLMNAGTNMGQLSACFVLPVPDSIEGIFSAVKSMALIHQSGGGTGFSFSNLRPEGDVVLSTKGIASGPISFMRIFDTSTEVIKQGGRRRGANMGILHVNHPDVEKFIKAKQKEGLLKNFNLSVAVDDSFMKAVERDEDHALINPRTGEEAKRVKAKHLFEIAVHAAWSTGDPGLIFLDEINRYNPTPQLGAIESTNPCGEQPLLPYESCTLGSIDIAKFVDGGKINWRQLKDLVHLAVHFLDNIIDVNNFPLPKIKAMTKGNRKIGLGIMGWAEALIKMEVPYNSERALKIGEKVMKFITDEGRRKSVEFAEERVSFPNFKGSLWEKKGYKKLRNATITTIAPTGTISITAGATSGIEPLFAVSYVRNVMEGTRLLEVNPVFEATAKERGFYSRELMMEIAKRGSVREIANVPDDVKRLFITALDITPEWHVKMQAAFQKHTDNAVSKTVNLPADASLEDVRNAFMLAYQLKCKGITVYRYGSKREQVLSITPVEERLLGEEPVTAESEFSGGCPAAQCTY